MVVAAHVDDPHVMHAAGRLSLGAVRHGKETNGDGHGEGRAYDDHPACTPGDAGNSPRLRAHPATRGGEPDRATMINITFVQLGHVAYCTPNASLTRRGERGVRHPRLRHERWLVL